MAALLWIVLAVVLAIAEAFTATLVLIMLAAGATAAAVAAALGLGIPGQVVVFSVVSVLSLVGLRPIIRKHALPALMGRDEPVGERALEGASATVVEQVTRDRGLVRIDGELWTARAFDVDQVIGPDQPVTVVEVQGASVLVWRDEPIEEGHLQAPEGSGGPEGED